MNTPVNKPPKSKVVKVIKDDGETRLLQKQTFKSKWTFFTVEHSKDKLNKALERMNTIAEQISLRNKLIDSTSVDNYMINNSSIKTSSCNGRIESCHHLKNILRPRKQERY